MALGVKSASTDQAQGWRGRIAADARSEGVSERFARTLFWLPFVVLVLTVGTYAYRPLFYALLEEDRVYEWGQFAFCLVTAGLALGAAWHRMHRRWWLATLFLLAVAFGCFVLAGEEISWGQRVFALSDPNIQEINRQGELNLHNINAGGFELEEAFRLVMGLIGLFGVVAPLVVRRRPPASRTGELLRVITPPLFLAPYFLMIFGYRLMRLVFEEQTEIAPLIKLQEFAELCLYGALAVMVGLLFLHARAACGLVPNPFDEPRRAPDTVLRASDGSRLTRDHLRLFVPLVTIVLSVTAIFAFMSALSGVAPGN